jgi:hypothetical protein
MNKHEDKITVKGCLKVQVFRRGMLIDEWEDSNVIVEAAKSALAMLISGAGTGKVVSKIGFGTSATPPDMADAALTDAYIRPLNTASYPEPGQVRFYWLLGAEEANGINIAEFGLICADGTLFSRRTRAAIFKETDISLSGAWTISF